MRLGGLRPSRPVGRGALVAALAVLVPTLAAAQPVFDPTNPVQQEIDGVYELLLDDPTDPDLNRRLVQLALALEDVDAAIGAVERLVFLDPSNVTLLIEVAELYLQIDSFAAASGYINDGLALPNLSAADRARLEELAEIVDDASRPPVFSGVVQAGIRYQTNANVGPTEIGPEQNLPVEDPTEDFNAFILGTLAYANRVSDHLILEASVSGTYAEQFSVDRLDLGFVEVQAGPRLLLHDGQVGIKPYAISQGVLLDDIPYQLTYGGGVLVSAALTPRWRTEAEFEYKDRTFFDSVDDPEVPPLVDTSNSALSGELFSYTLRSIGQVSDRLSFSARVTFNQNLAVEDHNSFDQVIVNLSMAYGFDLLGKEGWTFSPFARFLWAGYKGLDLNEALIGFDEIREDFQWSVGATLEVPVKEFTTFSAQVQYRSNESNLSRFTYDNLQVIVGPVGRF